MSWDVALGMAKIGFEVFPLRDNAKQPRKRSVEERTQDSLGRGSFYVATTDSETINFWAEIMPQANYAIKCGDNVTVLDLDRHGSEQDGALVVENWCQKIGGCHLHQDLMLKTFMVETPSNGYHLYFNKFPGISRTLTSGVELQNFGRYVVGPGCWVKGKMYKGFGDPTALMTAPSWLQKVVNGTFGERSGVPTSTNKMTIAACIDMYGNVPLGFRHDAVFMEMFLMFQIDGLEQGDAFDRIKELITEHFEDNPFSDNELKRNMKNVLRRLDIEPEGWLFDE